MTHGNYIPRPSHGAAWVTGGSAGIGRALVKRLVKKGWTVYVTARSEDELNALSEETGGKAIPAPGDVTNAEAMAAIVGRIEASEGLALAIFNAGIYKPVRAREFTAETAKLHFDVNLGGVSNGLAPAMKAMLAKDRGCLALVASVAGYRGLPRASAYGATKAALINMAEALAFDLNQTGVRISVISPGFVDTEATAVNDFDMPFVMTPDEAAGHIVKGLDKKIFEIHFPKKFSYMLKVMRWLPAKVYFWLATKAMGWDKIDD